MLFISVINISSGMLSPSPAHAAGALSRLSRVSASLRPLRAGPERRPAAVGSLGYILVVILVIMIYHDFFTDTSCCHYVY